MPRYDALLGKLVTDSKRLPSVAEKNKLAAIGNVYTSPVVPTAQFDDIHGYRRFDVVICTGVSPIEAFRCLDATTDTAIWANTTLTLEEVLAAIPGGSTSTFNPAYAPVIEYPDKYGNLSGHTGRWTASGSGTNEYYYAFDIPEPTNVLYNGSSATGGTIGSLADHQWGWGDNDSLGYNTLYVRDDSGDPDGLAVNLWMADWWGVASATPAFADEEDLGWPVHFDESTDQGLIARLKEIPTDTTNWTLRFWARTADRSSSGTITMRCLDRAVKTDGPDKPTATTLASATFSLTAKGSIVEISGTIANLDASVGEMADICFIRDVSEDAIATPMVVDLDTVEVELS